MKSFLAALVVLSFGIVGYSAVDRGVEVNMLSQVADSARYRIQWTAATNSTHYRLSVGPVGETLQTSETTFLADTLWVSLHPTQRNYRTCVVGINRSPNDEKIGPESCANFQTPAPQLPVPGQPGVPVPTIITSTTPPPTGDVVFSSNWSTATGNSINALRDGGNFPVQVCQDSSLQQMMSVVAGSTVGWPHTPNVLQITNQGSAICGLMGFENKIPLVSEYFVRIYINGISLRPGGTTFHSVKQAWGGGTNPVGATYWAIADIPTLGTYNPRIGGQHVGLAQFGYVGPTLNQNTWYRFEYRVEFFDPANPLRLRVWPFIYDMAGNLIGDADEYMNTNFNPTSLAQDYAAGGYRTTETRARGYHFFLGYEGTGGNENVGDRWAYAGVEIRTDGFSGGF